MGDKTSIEWTDKTFNPWWGCSHVGPDCLGCYAEAWANRTGNSGLWGKDSERRTFGDQHWNGPVRWNREAEGADRPTLVFCASMADVFEDHPELPAPRARLWDLIEATPNLIWQLLTKRPENVAGMVPWAPSDWPGNIWLGTSAGDTRLAAQRVPVLLAVAGPAVRFLSYEPAIGPLAVRPWLADVSERADEGWEYQCQAHGMDECDQDPACSGLQWVIAGGESGPKARPPHPEWFRQVLDDCLDAGVPFLFKQWGEWALGEDHPDRIARNLSQMGTPGSRTCIVAEFALDPVLYKRAAVMVKVGKKAAGRTLDGRTWSEFPAQARRG